MYMKIGMGGATLQERAFTLNIYIFSILGRNIKASSSNLNKQRSKELDKTNYPSSRITGAQVPNCLKESSYIRLDLYMSISVYHISGRG